MLILSSRTGDSTPDALGSTPTIFSPLEARLPSLLPSFFSLSPLAGDRKLRVQGIECPKQQRSSREACSVSMVTESGERPKLQIGRVKLARGQDPGLGKSSEGQVWVPPACGPWRGRSKRERESRVAQSPRIVTGYAKYPDPIATLFSCPALP